MSKKVDIKKVKAAKAKKESRPVTSIRLAQSERELLIKEFGSVQEAVNCLVKSLKNHRP